MTLQLSQTRILNLKLDPNPLQFFSPYSLIVLSVITVEYFIDPSLLTTSYLGSFGISFKVIFLYTGLPHELMATNKNLPSTVKNFPLTSTLPVSLLTYIKFCYSLVRSFLSASYNEKTI